MKKHLFSIVYYILLLGASAYLMYDIFFVGERFTPIVIPSSTPTAEPSPTPLPTDTSTPTPTVKPGDPTPTPSDTPTPTSTPTPTFTPTPTNTPTPIPEGAEVIFEHNDGDINIQVVRYREYGSTIYVSDIELSSLDYFKISMDLNSKGEVQMGLPEKLAEKHNAILAINGDMCNSSAGYTVRNGVVYRTKKATIKTDGLIREDLVLFRDGTHKFINEDEVTCEELIDEGAWNILSFGPILIEDGEVVYTSKTCLSDKKTLSYYNPRTAIGQTADGHYIFIVVDGRNPEVDRGVLFEELIKIAQKAGCVWLYNLDGGQSSQLVFDGKVQNKPYSSQTGVYKERSLSEIVYIGYE